MQLAQLVLAAVSATRTFVPAAAPAVAPATAAYLGLARSRSILDLDLLSTYVLLSLHTSPHLLDPSFSAAPRYVLLKNQNKIFLPMPITIVVAIAP